ncbi:1123_t:CDS:1, partial [Diversispora eburnea]
QDMLFMHTESENLIDPKLADIDSWTKENGIYPRKSYELGDNHSARLHQALKL